MEEAVKQPEELAIPTAPKEYKQTDPTEALSNVFGMYKTPFINIVDRLKTNSLKRLLKSLILLPLEDHVPNLKRPEEKSAYQIGEKLLLAKMALITQFFMEEEAKKAKLLEETKTTEATTAEVINKESNG